MSARLGHIHTEKWGKMLQAATTFLGRPRDYECSGAKHIVGAIFKAVHVYKIVGYGEGLWDSAIECCDTDDWGSTSS